MNKILHVSHRADCDGLMPIILSRLVFDNFDSLLLEASEIDMVLSTMIQEGELDLYDQIYITDLCIGEELALRISSSELVSKILIFDHHHSCLSMNKFSFITVVDIDESLKKQCGSSLYYQYLLTHFDFPILKKKSVSQMVELTRSLDTWEWYDTGNEDAKKLGNLFDIYGKEYYEEYFVSYLLQHETFSFDEKQIYLLEVEEKRIQKYIDKKSKEITTVEIDGYCIGVVLAELYRSALGNVLAERFPNYDFIVVINVSRSVSYRGVKDIDLGLFALKYGGKGHVHASGSPLPNDFKNIIIKSVFEDCKIIEEG